ncbi:MULTISPECIES: TylF/MycF/NovP-related O-methyltransferase [unclassified Bradyrhizobium]|uniref:TylF/MycF/NovP-related O-methyltransferase n=1 Tax=unclassified Bradyrhizobium TaxID=2631580 RepID=UPI0028F15DC5|nr:MULTISPECIES: TylF/MycF/NovP-related O-methyltransferase [unclassified Bradyrhizobium]
MTKSLKVAIAEGLPPQTLFRLRSIKRALMGQAPLEPPQAGPSRQPEPTPPKPEPGPPAVELPPQPEPRTKQTEALERLDAHKISAPYLFFDVDDVLILPAKEIARTLTLSVMYINSADVRGDIAEFGTMGGFTARTLANAMVFDPRYQPNQPLRKLRLFDSFEGLPEITATVDLESQHVKSGTWSRGGCRILSAAELQTMVEAIIPPSRVQIYEGWFADTVKTLPDDTRLALIHFDGDLYSSTMDALVPCFERGFVSKGAVICFDDWNCNEADPEAGERKAWADLVNRFKIVASHSGDYSIQGTKFIIHSYRGMKPRSA